MCLNIRENPEICPHIYSVHINYLQIYIHMNEIWMRSAHALIVLAIWQKKKMCRSLTKAILRRDEEALTEETVRTSQSQGWLLSHFTLNLITMIAWHLARQWDDENGRKLLILDPHHTDLKRHLSVILLPTAVTLHGNEQQSVLLV